MSGKPLPKPLTEDVVLGAMRVYADSIAMLMGALKEIDLVVQEVNDPSRELDAFDGLTRIEGIVERMFEGDDDAQ